MKNDQHDIFEDLQHLLALDYLSDLKFHPYRKEAERLLVSLDLTKYPLRALCEIAEYLFSKKFPFPRMRTPPNFLPERRSAAILKAKRKKQTSLNKGFKSFTGECTARQNAYRKRASADAR